MHRPTPEDPASPGRWARPDRDRSARAPGYRPAHLRGILLARAAGWPWGLSFANRTHWTPPLSVAPEEVRRGSGPKCRRQGGLKRQAPGSFPIPAPRDDCSPTPNFGLYTATPLNDGGASIFPRTMAILLPYVPCRFSYIRPPTLSFAFKGGGLERRRVCLIGNRD